MRYLVPCLFSFSGVFLIVAVSPSRAAILKQNFEITATSPPFIVREAQPGAAQNAVFPAIGTTGFGSFVYNESQINFGNNPNAPANYYLRIPDLSEFSLNFFNRTYTQVSSLPSRVGGFVSFDRNTAGQFTPRSLYAGVSDSDSGLVINGSTFSYGQGNENYFGSVNGTFRFTESEPIPEPTTAIASSLAAGFGYLFQHRRKHKRQSKPD